MRYSRLSHQKQARILRYFCEEVTAVSTAVIAGVNRRTVDSYYREIRERIFSQTLKEHQQEKSL
ncbi:MAG: hypothetical protein LBT89_03780 [Planctomycetaceae bacterium]|jgi:DNA-binding CsgD family transcriptional regulator|nr:hypothetical protein [Planctomycetaceae bacterium]